MSRASRSFKQRQAPAISFSPSLPTSRTPCPPLTRNSLCIPVIRSSAPASARAPSGPSSYIRCGSGALQGPLRPSSPPYRLCQHRPKFNMPKLDSVDEFFFLSSSLSLSLFLFLSFSFSLSLSLSLVLHHHHASLWNFSITQASCVSDVHLYPG
jgi:hypothetical protein